MNPLNHATLEACQRLVNAGIVLETDCYYRIWTAKATNTLCSEVVTKSQMLFNKHGDEVGDGRDMDGVSYIPDPSWEEVWRELPKSIEGHYGFSKTIKPGVVGYEYNSNWLYYITDTNLTDALIDLLIWVTEQEIKEQ